MTDIDFGPDKLAPKKGENYGLVGSIGSGKTTYYRKVIHRTFPRKLIVDFEKMEFDDIPRIKRNVPMQTVVKRIADTASDMTPFSWRLAVPSPEHTDLDEWMDSLCWPLIRARRLSMLLYIDETGRFCTPHHIPEGLKAAASLGRKRGLCIVWGTQRPQMTNNVLWNLSVHKSLFYMDRSDRGFLDDKVKAGEIDGVREEKISNLVAKIPYHSYRSLYLGPDRTELMGPA